MLCKRYIVLLITLLVYFVTQCPLCLQKVEKLKAMLHSLDNQPSNKHIYFAEDRFVLESLRSKHSLPPFLYFIPCRLV